jgi:hypothetical protein
MKSVATEFELHLYLLILYYECNKCVKLGKTNSLLCTFLFKIERVVVINYMCDLTTYYWQCEVQEQQGQ